MGALHILNLQSSNACSLLDFPCNVTLYHMLFRITCRSRYRSNLVKDVSALAKKTPWAKVDIFPSERQKLVSEVLACFEADHGEQETASKFNSDGNQIILKELQEKFPAVTSASPSDALVAAMEEVGGDAVDCKPELPDTMLIGDWERHVLAKDEGGDDKAVPILMEKRIVAAANSYFLDVACDTLSKEPDGLRSSLSIALKQALLKEGEENAKVTKATLFRKEAVAAPVRDPAFGLPYFGKVVTESAASTLPKVSTLPLGDNNGAGPSLFLDGSPVLNMLRPDHCIAWQCRRVKVTKAKDDDVQESSPAKKAKTTKGQVQTYVAPKEPVPTHEIAWVPFELDVNDMSGIKQKFHYQRPVLIDSDDPIALAMIGEAVRKLTSFDEVDQQKKRKDAKKTATFAMQ